LQLISNPLGGSTIEADMMATPSIEAWVQDSLGKYLHGDPRFPRGFEELASGQHLLPLGYDLAYAYFLNEQGVVFYEDALEREAGIQRVEDAAERHTVIRAYSRTFPELLSLLPERPDHASTCDHCSGSGFMTLPCVDGRGREIPCSSCSGVGWTGAAA
jgi:hypothetical protein